MKICLFNQLNCELGAWKVEEFAQELLAGKIDLVAGDTLRVEADPDDALDDFNYVGSRHHY